MSAYEILMSQLEKMVNYERKTKDFKVAASASDCKKLNEILSYRGFIKYNGFAYAIRDRSDVYRLGLALLYDVIKEQLSKKEERNDKHDSDSGSVGGGCEAQGAGEGELV